MSASPPRRVLLLPPDATSARAAREWLATHLGDAPTATVDAALLLVSELVTNAVLHARTSIEVRLERCGEAVRVETVDGSTLLPTARRWSPDATTGRGLHLVERVASRWGVVAEADRKTVWFELGGATSGGRGPTDSPPDPSARARRSEEPLRPYHLLGIPSEQMAHAAEHYEGLLRELQLLVVHHRVGGEAGERLVELAAAITGRFPAPSIADPRCSTTASALDLEDYLYYVPDEVAAGCRELDHLLDEADDYCREGRLLLTLAPSPLAVAVRRWCLGEFARQARGERPVPWTESAWSRTVPGACPHGPRADVALRQRQVGSRTVLELEGELDLHAAPRLREQLLEATSHGPSRLVLDLAGVRLVDSTCRSLLLAGLRRSRDRGGDLCVCHLAPGVAHALRLDGELPIFETLDEALRA
ncbi:MAG TPA: STAS domain-containing protein [Acidimicrobiales bacterium]|jgi:anti-anti-sigma factor|nr:STAS domain-containing protein [Acidimicrobiales bacterium]